MRPHVGRAGIVSVYAVAVALSSALLFLVQPFFAKVLLPSLGGAPAVWTTCVLFFQIALLAAYFYAHLVGGRGYRPGAAIAHLVVIAIGLAWLPLDVAGTRGLAVGAQSAPRLLWAAAITLGPPLFAVAATAPLLQRWYSAIDPDRADEAYSLYAASNAGSLGGLLLYPLVVERSLTLTAQSRSWHGGYVVLLLAVATAAALAHFACRGDRGGTVGPPERDSSHRAAPLPRRLVLSWIVRAAIATALMQAVTVYLTTDIAASPLLWVLPLSAYLLTFVIAFAPGLKPPVRLVGALVPVGGLSLVVALLTHMTGPVWLLFGVHLSAVFLLELGCHVAISASRPDARHLTIYYLWIAVGGVLGSAFALLVAPRIFSSPVEYPILVVAACLLRPGGRVLSGTRQALVTDAAWAVAALGGALVVRACLNEAGIESRPFVMLVGTLAVPITAAALQWPRARRFGFLLIALWASGPAFDSDRIVHTRRNFFGVLRVADSSDNRLRLFFHGTTIHGVESRDPQHRAEPLGYYSRLGPAGQVFSAFGPQLPRGRVAVVGLGTGALVSYALPGQDWTFIEIDPDVAAIATHDFHYLSGASVNAHILIGDGRLALSRTASHSLDLLVIDAFSSDAVPVHLLTTEAVGIYMRALRPGAVLLLHVSNRYLDLGPIAAAVADASGLRGIVRTHVATDAERTNGLSSSSWAVLATRGEIMDHLATMPGWTALSHDAAVRPWTDDFSDVFEYIVWRR